MTKTLRIAEAPDERQRPDRGPRAIEADVDLENFILITHAVPAARVRAQLPDKIALETFEGDEGRETCFVTTACFCNRDLRPRLTNRPTHTFNQVTFRTYVTYGEARGLYFFGTYCDTISSFLWQGSMATGTKLSKFHFDMPKDGRGYSRYACTARAGAEEVSWLAEATDEPGAIHPFPNGYEHVQFLGYRLHGFSRNPFGFTRTAAWTTGSCGRSRDISSRVASTCGRAWGYSTRASTFRPHLYWLSHISASR